jgi:MFS family permease
MKSEARALRPVEWLNFFLADVQTGLGPFLAAYLASNHWTPAAVGYLLTFGGLVGVAMQTPAGAIVDNTRRKRTLLVGALIVLVVGALTLLAPPSVALVYAAQFLISTTGPFLAPTVAAITLGMVGAKAFNRQFGRNQSFNSAGNVFTALAIAGASYALGYRSIFVIAAMFSIPAFISIGQIDGDKIDFDRARGAEGGGKAAKVMGLGSLLRDRVLVTFLGTAFLFHLANAAMLPQLGEMLSKGQPKAAAPFMSACIIVTQLVIAANAGWIGKFAGAHGRKPLLLVGFGVLPIRGVLYTLTHFAPALIAIQILDGVANAIFGVVSILVITDLTRGTGRFNLAAGALAAMVGLGASLSTAIGGELIHHFSFNGSFLGLAAISTFAVALLAVAVPETLHGQRRAKAGDAR